MDDLNRAQPGASRPLEPAHSGADPAAVRTMDAAGDDAGLDALGDASVADAPLHRRKLRRPAEGGRTRSAAGLGAGDRHTGGGLIFSFGMRRFRRQFA